VCLHLSQGARK